MIVGFQWIKTPSLEEENRMNPIIREMWLVWECPKCGCTSRSRDTVSSALAEGDKLFYMVTCAEITCDYTCRLFLSRPVNVTSDILKSL